MTQDEGRVICNSLDNKNKNLRKKFSQNLRQKDSGQALRTCSNIAVDIANSLKLEHFWQGFFYVNSLLREVISAILEVVLSKNFNLSFFKQS